MRFAILIIAFTLALGTSVTASPKGQVLTTTPALAVLGQELAPVGVTVVYPGPADENASDWEPNDGTLRQYQAADLILLVGANYAGWVAQVSLPKARLVDTSAGFRDMFIATEAENSDHRHGPTGQAHQHGDFANHFWLDPQLAQLQARKIADAFIAFWPDEADAIKENLSRLELEVGQLDTALKQEFQTMKTERFFASHPVYQYLDRAMGLNLHSFHWEPDQAPSSKEWAKFDEVLGEAKNSTMIWEGEPLPDVLSALEARNVDIIVISPSQQNSKGDLRTRLGFPQKLEDRR